MTHEKKLGVGVIGLRMGMEHLNAYRLNPNCRVVGACDLNGKKLEAARNDHGATVTTTDYRELLANPDIQIVSVATPDFDHVEQCVAALKAGKDVLCEKPMTTTMEDARAIIQAVKETGRRFMVGQVCRYAPGFVLAKRLIDRGEIGEIFLVESEYAHNYERAKGVGNWRMDARREPFLGGGCHAVDLVRWIAGDAEEVFAYSNHKCLPDWPVQDCTMAAYRFKSGAIGKVMVSIGCVRPYTMRSVFYGTTGTIICDNTSTELFLCRSGNFTGAPAFATLPVGTSSHNVVAEIAEFVDCILNDSPVPANEVEGAKTVATALAAVKSAKEGRPVKISELFP